MAGLNLDDGWLYAALLGGAGIVALGAVAYQQSTVPPRTDGDSLFTGPGHYRVRNREDQYPNATYDFEGSETERHGYYNTGIRNEQAARRDVKRRYGSEPAEEVVSRSGAKFYVTAKSGRKAAFLLGPYSSHMSAQMNVEKARRLLREKYPNEAFVAVGTASSPETLETKFGR